MLDDPRSDAMLQDFALQWLRIEPLLNASKDANLYPAFTPALAAEMQTETTTFFRNLVKGNSGDFTTLLTAPYSYVDGDLMGAVYNPTSGMTGTTFNQATLPAGQRAGILTQASVLTTLAHANRASPVFRGKLVREQF